MTNSIRLSCIWLGLVLSAGNVLGQLNGQTVQRIAGSSCVVQIGNASGNVQITNFHCGGVSSVIEKKLLDLLKTRLSEDESLAKSNLNLSVAVASLTAQLSKWPRRYAKLKQRLSGTDAGQFMISGQLKDAIDRGDLTLAAHQVTSAIMEDEATATKTASLREAAKAIERLAEEHYVLSQIYSLGLERGQAIEEARRAFLLRPDVTDYGVGYGSLLVDEGEIPEAVTIFKLTAAHLRELTRVNGRLYNWNLAQVLDRLGNAYSQASRVDDSEKSYKDSIEILKGIAATGSVKDRVDLALTQNNLADQYEDTGRLADAQRTLKEALETLAQVSDASLPQYRGDQAMMQANLGNLYSDSSRWDDAKKMYLQSLQVFQELSKSQPQKYKPIIAGTLNSLGRAYDSLGDTVDAKRSLSESLQIRRSLAASDPQAYSQDLLASLDTMAEFYRHTNRLKDAETLLQEALKTCRQMQNGRGHQFDPDLALVLGELGTVYAASNQFQNADASFNEALGIYRRIARLSPEIYDKYLAVTLGNAAALYLKMQRREDAARALDEAIGILRPLAQLSPSEFGPNLAKMLESSAENDVELKRFVDAALCYKERLDILAESSSDDPEIRRRIEHTRDSLKSVCKVLGENHAPPVCQEFQNLK